MIYDDIKNFSCQFEYKPEIENGTRLKKGLKKFIVAGMGGSHLAADILQCWRPELDIVVWSDYGLPPLFDLKERLVIASSYSGNTEETISAFTAARKQGLAVAVMASGGKLLEKAKRLRAPYVQLPKLDIQPRMTTGLGIKALLALMRKRNLSREAAALAAALKPQRFETTGKKLARVLRGRVPIIYASEQNRAVAQIWKIKFNETGKIPAFWNVLPELNHNEMTGFDAERATAPLSKNLQFILLGDAEDDPRILKRSRVLQKLFAKRNLRTTSVPLGGRSRLERIFSSIILADWTSYYTAKLYGIEPEKVPMVEKFKKLISKE